MAKTTKGRKGTTDRQVRAERRNKTQGVKDSNDQVEVSDLGEGPSSCPACMGQNVTRGVGRELLSQTSDEMTEEYVEGDISEELYEDEEYQRFESKTESVEDCRLIWKCRI